VPDVRLRGVTCFRSTCRCCIELFVRSRQTFSFSREAITKRMLLPLKGHACQ
jgi:hypothetical protein